MALTSRSTAARCAAASETNPARRAVRTTAYKAWLDAQDDLEQAREALLAATSRGFYSGSQVQVLANAVKFLAEVSVELVPTITSLTPATGPAAGGTRVAAVGKDFTPATTWAIGGVACTDVHFVDSQHMNFLSGAHAAATVQAVATNEIGASGNKQYIYT